MSIRQALLTPADSAPAHIHEKHYYHDQYFLTSSHAQRPAETNGLPNSWTVSPQDKVGMNCRCIYLILRRIGLGWHAGVGRSPENLVNRRF